MTILTGDYAKYQELVEQFRTTINPVTRDRLWRELEEIKNRNQGMPPTKPEKEFCESVARPDALPKTE
jgi:hypothetical protein